MQKKYFKSIFSIFLALIMLLSTTTTAFASDADEILSKTIAVGNVKRSVDWSSTPFYGSKSTDYTEYVGVRSRSEALESTIATISSAVLTVVISRSIGLGGEFAKDVANGILGAAVSIGTSASSSSLYFTETIYNNVNNPFQQEHIYRYYTDKKHKHYLYTAIAYSQTTPL